MVDEEPTEAAWLDAAFVRSVLGGIDVEASPLGVICTGVRSYVEQKRADLNVTTVVDDVTTVTFTPTEAVRLGAAMLAYRLYNRRTSPLGVLGFTEDGAASILTTDPDISMLLGIGKRGRFVFGGAAPLDVVEVVS